MPSAAASGGIGYEARGRHAGNRVHFQHVAAAVSGDHAVRAGHPFAAQHIERVDGDPGQLLQRFLRQRGRDDVDDAADGIFGREIVEFRTRFDEDDGPHRDGPVLFTHHADRRLAACDIAFHQDLLVEGEGRLQSLLHFGFRFGDGDTDARTLRGRFDDHGQGIFFDDLFRQVRIVLVFIVIEISFGRRDAAAQEDALRGDLVHAQGTGQDAGPRVGHPHHLQGALQPPVFAVQAVDGHESRFGTAGLQLFRKITGIEADFRHFVPLFAQCAGNAFACRQGNFRFGRRAAHDDGYGTGFLQHHFSTSRNSFNRVSPMRNTSPAPMVMIRSPAAAVLNR